MTTERNRDYSKYNYDTPEIESLILEYLAHRVQINGSQSTKLSDMKEYFRRNRKEIIFFGFEGGSYAEKLDLLLDEQDNLTRIDPQQILDLLDDPICEEFIKSFRDREFAYEGLSIEKSVAKIREYGKDSIFLQSPEYEEIENIIKEKMARLRPTADITVLLEGNKEKGNLKTIEDQSKQDTEDDSDDANSGDGTQPGSLISQPFFDYNVNNLHYYVRTRNMISEWNVLLMKDVEANWDTRMFESTVYKNTGYVPLHTLTFLPDPDFPWILFKSPDPDIFASYAQVSKIFSYSPSYVSFIKKCIERKYYNLVLFSRAEEDGHTTAANIKDNLIKRFDSYLTRDIVLDLPIPVFNSKITLNELFDQTRNIVTWNSVTLSSSNELNGYTNFLTNFYYLAGIKNLGFSTVSFSTFYSAMVKVEDVGHVRACMVTNTPIPTDKLELWIDESFENINPRLSARKEFAKSIRKPMSQAGIKIVVHKDLTDVIFDYPKAPSFKTITDQEEWLRELSTGFMEDKRSELGIKITRVESPVESKEPEQVVIKSDRVVEKVSSTISEEEMASLMDQLRLLDEEEVNLANDQAQEVASRNAGSVSLDEDDDDLELNEDHDEYDPDLDDDESDDITDGNRGSSSNDPW